MLGGVGRRAPNSLDFWETCGRMLGGVRRPAPNESFVLAARLEAIQVNQRRLDYSAEFGLLAKLLGRIDDFHTFDVLIEQLLHEGDEGAGSAGVIDDDCSLRLRGSDPGAGRLVNADEDQGAAARKRARIWIDPPDGKEPSQGGIGLAVGPETDEGVGRELAK